MGRRKETTEYLKTSLADAFLKLLEKKPFEKIGLQEVADKAGVGRVTFYRHFSTKQDLISYKMHALWETYCDKHPIPDTELSEETTKWFFDFIYENRKLMKLLYRLKLLSYSHDFLLDVIRQQKPVRGEERYALAFLTYGIEGVITEWTAGGFRENTDEMLALFARFYPAGA